MAASHLARTSPHCRLVSERILESSISQARGRIILHHSSPDAHYSPVQILYINCLSQSSCESPVDANKALIHLESPSGFGARFGSLVLELITLKVQCPRVGFDTFFVQGPMFDPHVTVLGIRYLQTSFVIHHAMLHSEKPTCDSFCPPASSPFLK